MKNILRCTQDVSALLKKSDLQNEIEELVLDINSSGGMLTESLKAIGTIPMHLSDSEGDRVHAEVQIVLTIDPDGKILDKR